jgi:hypothetical protein|tara:strand:- start:349 stop:552 length:204 start_codon:yes stop_codon:yes gene_type:complete
MKYQVECLKNEIKRINLDNLKHNSLKSSVNNIIDRLEQIEQGKEPYNKPNYYSNEHTKKVKLRKETK